MSTLGMRSASDTGAAAAPPPPLSSSPSSSALRTLGPLVGAGAVSPDAWEGGSEREGGREGEREGERGINGKQSCRI